jgi:hypothetical protein
VLFGFARETREELQLLVDRLECQDPSIPLRRPSEMLVDAVVCRKPDTLQLLGREREGHEPGSKATQAKHVLAATCSRLLQQLPRRGRDDIGQTHAGLQPPELQHALRGTELSGRVER